MKYPLQFGNQVQDNIIDVISGIGAGGENVLKAQLNATMTNNTSVSAQTMTNRATVNGSGWIIGIARKTAFQDYNSLKIDGNFVIGSLTSGRQMANLGFEPIMLRFNSSFEYYNKDNYCCIIYTLGDDMSKPLTLKQYGLPTSGTASNLALNITGKGWLNNITLSNNNSFARATKITIDGIVQFDSLSPDLGSMPIMLRFEQSLRIDTELLSELDFSYSLE